MALLTRQSKGSKLTIEEMDNNLLYLESLSGSTSGGSEPELVTYDELVTKIQGGTLVKGKFYTIIDFTTKHYILDYGDVWLDDSNNPEIYTGPNEPLTVQALSANKIYHNATSELYPNDIIHYDWNPDNWILDVAFAAYDEVVLPGWKGVIYWRKYTINNISAPTDWRHVKVRRWAASSMFSGFTTLYMIGNSSSSDVPDSNDYQDFTLFNEYDQHTIDNRVLNIEIKPVKDNSYFWYWSGTIMLDSVFFIDPYDYWIIINNTFNGPFFNNTISSDEFSLNDITGSFLNNIIGGSFYSNKIVYFKGNIIANEFSNNIINEFYNNTVYSKFIINTVNNSFYSSTINDINNSVVGANNFELKFVSNIINGEMQNNTFKYTSTCTFNNGFRYNNIGNYIFNCTFGSYIDYNNFGNNIQSCNFGNTFKNNTIGNSIIYCDFGDNFGREVDNFGGNVVENNISGLTFSGGNYVNSNIFRSGLKNLTFTNASKVYNRYNCEVFTNSAGVAKLKYVDDTDTIVIVDINS